MRRWKTFALAAAATLAAAAPAQGAPTTTEYSTGIPAGAGPNGVAAGPDGNVWFTESDASGAIGRIGTAGTITRYDVSSHGVPDRITAGPGGLWATLPANDRILRLSTVGTVTRFSAKEGPLGIAEGPDGNLWFTAYKAKGYIGRLTTGGVVTKFNTGLTDNMQPGDIVAGPDGNLWFTEAAGTSLGRITPQGVITEFPTGSLTDHPRDLAVGPDGNLWFTESGAVGAAIKRMTPQGVVTTYSYGLGLGLLAAPLHITQGGDGALYFTDTTADAVYRVATDGTLGQAASLPAGADPHGIVSGADGALWIAERGRNRLARVTVNPVAGSATASAIGATTATIEGAVVPNAQATAAYVEWGPTTAYGSRTADLALAAGALSRTVSIPLTGLAAGTTYHARLVAVNLTGITRGPDFTFATTLLNAPAVSTEPVSLVGPDGATLNATVNPQGNPTSYRFEWGPTSAYGSAAPAVDGAVGGDTAAHAVRETLDALEPNTTYHYRVVATSPIAQTAGPDRTFTTAAVAPDVQTGASAQVTGAGVTLGGTVNPRNSETSYRFEWGPTTDYGRLVPAEDAAAGAGNVTQAVSQALTGLEPSTEYHFRLVATSPGGTSYGEDETFTTPVALPGVATNDPEAVEAESVLFKADLDPFGASVTRWFEWGPTTGYGNQTPETTVNGRGARTVTAHVKGLTAGTTYHVRVAARSLAGVAYGEDRTFTTLAPEPVLTPTPTPTPTPEITPAAAEPAYGRSVAASVKSGTVKVRPPGSLEYVEVDAAGVIPNGSVVDASAGSVTVVSALDRDGATQSATFRGARFRIAQRRTGNGVVDIHLVQRATGCPTTPGTGVGALASAKRRVKRPSLWSSDHHGKYRTHGRNSVATVRGTTWVTTETCRGTRTTVKSGAVSVKDRATGRRTLVKAGHSLLVAKAP